MVNGPSLGRPAEQSKPEAIRFPAQSLGRLKDFRRKLAAGWKQRPEFLKT